MEAHTINLNSFLDMYRFTIVVCPLNVTTKQVATHVKRYIQGEVIMKENIEQCDTLLLCETEKTNLRMLLPGEVDAPPKRVCLFVGFGTKLNQVPELSEFQIPILFASFCEINAKLNIKLYPIKTLYNNVLLTSSDTCNLDECNVREFMSTGNAQHLNDSSVYIDDGNHYNIEDAITVHLRNNVSLKLLKSLAKNGNKNVYVYYDEFTEVKYRDIIAKYEMMLEDYLNLRSTCTVSIELESNELIVNV